MAVPARKVSKTRGATRRAHLALSQKAVTKCPNCGAIIKSHRVCSNCGTYKNKQVIEEVEKQEVVETKEVKKEKVKKEKSKKEE
jgi:large subunit ribosomal protein L32